MAKEKVGKKKIVLLDAERDFVAALKGLLEAEGFQVATAATGDAGLALIKKEKPNLVVMDAVLSTPTEGFDLCRKFSQVAELHKVPVLMATGITRLMSLPFKFEPDPIWLPAQAAFEKPIAPAHLVAELKKRLQS